MSDSMATLAGGTKALAQFRDGTTEDVFLAQLPVRKLQDYLSSMDDEPARLELITGKPKGWADNLTHDSHNALLAAGEALNETSFFAWLRRRVARQEQLAPGSSGELGKRLLSASPTGSPSARSAAA